MNDKLKFNPKIHHRRSIRLKGYDYSQAGLYFLTLCCHDQECWFGEIKVEAENLGPEMVLNEAGKIADNCWLEIPEHFPNAILHEHIVMPNHVHGIIELSGTDAVNVGAKNEGEVGAENFLPLRDANPNIKLQRNEFQKMISRSISSIEKGYKIGVTKELRNVNAKDFPPQRKIWQRNFYEHIIRDEKSYQTIFEYIRINPAKWMDDKFYKK